MISWFIFTTADDYQMAFDGPEKHHESFLTIKHRHDPEGMFYGLTAGSSKPHRKTHLNF